MSKNKKIFIGILIVVLIIVIGAFVAYKVIEKSVTNRENFNFTVEDISSNPVDTTNNGNTENSTFIKTYNVLNVTDSNDENYLYLTVNQFQDEEIETVKVQKSLANIVKEKNSYEFTFQYTDNIVEDNIESIFANTILISIKETDKQGLEQIQDTIRYDKNNLSEIEESYSGKFPKRITIYAGEEVNKNIDNTFVYNYETLTNEEYIKNGKEQLNKVLNKYPEGFWDELLLGKNGYRKSLVICLVGELFDNNTNSSPTAFATYDDDTNYVFINSSHVGPMMGNIEQTIFHELMHIIDFYLQDIGEQYSDWYTYLPDGFEYTGYGANHSEEEFSMCIFDAINDNDVWFDGIYSTETVLEDRACMMSSMYDNGLSYYKKYPHLYARMKYLKDILYKNFESIRNCEYDWLE